MSYLNLDRSSTQTFAVPSGVFFPLPLLLVTFNCNKMTIRCTVPPVTVPDRRSQNIPEVVLVRRWAVGVLGIWRGKGLGEGWDKGGSVYKQPETEVDDSCHS